jgi:hypothetical protein
VASVVENQIVDKRMEAARFPGVYLDLHAVRCKIENSLKGGLIEPEITFFYFADGKYPDAKPYQRPKRLFEANPGARYLFFLTRDRGVLRSIGDVFDYSTRIYAGAHAERLAKDEDIGRRISEILLTPGEGANRDQLAANLSDAIEVADFWGSRPLTVQLLRHLFSLPEPLRSAACGELESRFRGQWDCLQVIAEDVTISPEQRQRVLGALKEQVVGRQLLLEDLKDPAQMAYMNWDGDSRHRVREELETLLFVADPVLRERACTALKRYYPWDAEERCSGVKVHFSEP